MGIARPAPSIRAPCARLGGLRSAPPALRPAETRRGLRRGRAGVTDPARLIPPCAAACASAYAALGGCLLRKPPAFRALRGV